MSRSFTSVDGIWSAGFEPAISDARSRWGGPSPLRPVNSTSSPAGLEPATRGVEALCSSAELRGDRRPWNRTTLHRRIRAAPAQPARRRISPGGLEPPSPTLARWCSDPLSYGEKAIYQRSRRESNPPHPGDSQAAPPGASESIEMEPRGIEPRSGGCKPPSWPPKAPRRATAGTSGCRGERVSGRSRARCPE